MVVTSLENIGRIALALKVDVGAGLFEKHPILHLPAPGNGRHEQ